MYSIKISIIVMANLLLMGCTKQHMRTDSICDKGLYIEFYQEWAGMGTSYLTDSINFRINLGRFIPESEYLRFECKNDSLVVFKSMTSDSEKPKQVLEIKRFSIKELKKEGKFDK